MILVEAEKTFEVCHGLRQRKRSHRELYAKQRGATAELAKLEQEIAELQDRELQSLTRMTDGVVELGRLLLDGLLLTNSAKQSDQTAAQSGPAVSDQDALRFISDCARRAEFCLEGVAESLANEDQHSATIYCEQARRLMGALRRIQDAWPWPNLEAMKESWSQYQRGELMDFETFKHELLKAAK